MHFSIFLFKSDKAILHLIIKSCSWHICYLFSGKFDLMVHLMVGKFVYLKYSDLC